MATTGRRTMTCSWTGRAACAALLAVVWGWPAAPAPGAAAAYQQLPIPQAFQNPLEVGKRRIGKDKILRSTGGLGQDSAAQLQQWYNNYFFPSMTRLDQLGDLASKRAQLLRDLVTCRRNQQIHDLIIQWTLRALDGAGAKALVRGPYHPGVRYNAMLILGYLNAVEPDVGQKTPPAPLPQATDILIREYEDANQLDAVRVAALIGMQRHARLAGPRMPEPQRAKITGDMLALATTADPPPGRTAEAHTWMRRRAVDVLAAFGDPGADGSIAQTLAGLAADEDEPLTLRITAASALGKLKYAGDVGIDPNVAARQLGALAAAACRDELARIDEEKKKALLKERMASGATSFGGGYGGEEAEYEDEYGSEEEEEEEEEFGDLFGGMGAVSAASAEEARKVRFTRRRMKQFLFHVREGLLGDGKRRNMQLATATAPPPGGIALLAQTDSHKAAVDEVLKAVDQIDAALDVKTDQVEEAALTIDTLTETLRPLISSLETLAGAGGPGTAPGAPAAGPAAELPGALPGGPLPGLPGGAPAPGAATPSGPAAAGAPSPGG